MRVKPDRYRSSLNLSKHLLSLPLTIPSVSCSGAIMDAETTSHHLLLSPVNLKDSEALKLLHSATLFSHSYADHNVATTSHCTLWYSFRKSC